MFDIVLNRFLRATVSIRSENNFFWVIKKRVLHTYSNQSIDVQSKSVDWFLYVCNTRT